MKHSFELKSSVFCLFDLGSTPLMYCAEKEYNKTEVEPVQDGKTGIYA